MKENTSVKGFTLIELLVVIAIIAILAGILLPAVIGAFKKASDAQALSEVKSIETAVKQYFNEYGKYPRFNATSDKIYGEAVDQKGDRIYSGVEGNSSLIRILRAVAGSDNEDHIQNKRRIVFLEVNENSLSNDNFVDPWGVQYMIGIDANFDNIVDLDKQSTGLDPAQSRGVVVWSFGAEQKAGSAYTNKYITSWR